MLMSDDLPTFGTPQTIMIQGSDWTSAVALTPPTGRGSVLLADGLRGAGCTPAAECSAGRKELQALAHLSTLAWSSVATLLV